MVALGVWGLTLEPGKKYDLVSEYDIHLTGVTFGEEVKGDKRSVLKVYTMTFPEGDEDDDDEDEDVKEEAEAAEGKAKAKAAAKKAAEADKKDEDDDDDDDEDIGELRETIVCSLVPSKIEFQNVNLVLTTSEEPVMLEVTGENTVYLSGNYIEQEMPHNDHIDDLEDDFDLNDVPSDVELDEDEMDAVLNGEMDEDEDEEMEGEPKIEEITASAEKPSKKRAREEEELSPAKPAEGEKKLSKAEKKRLNKKQKGADGEAKAAPEPEPKANGKAAAAEGKESTLKKIIELPGGVKIQDMKLGTGPHAKAGKKVGMRYIGKLQSNNKVFDSNVKGPLFKFVLGKGQVIKGWDEGVAGMAVGGERKLIIPPSKAYGSKGTEGIPANSTLIFEIKMVEMS
ncbi:hypothetical protein DACRYDRAFT_20679 [Dacryopinax primogenitus]|uniref:FK506-binding protein n=1 Tax=Dacryopinax primogenitus (strain DJM 731) TaxID=1858805 RepID=M5GCM4_DACPD|nr:uncharacterized protein DACRYDRAFT_20679 [Dacryopinax primogenitus]EJU03957.1 hypothetical protein DACRYDRAFT_20679 [Dacryopinax primogenitus]